MNKHRLRMVCASIIPALFLVGLRTVSVFAEPSDGRLLARWAIAIHGGAGSLSPDMDREQRDSLEQSLRQALQAGTKILSTGGSALDAVETVSHCMNEILEPGDGGIIAVDRQGRISMRATTGAMPRGVADSAGRFETAIEIDH